MLHVCMATEQKIVTIGFFRDSLLTNDYHNVTDASALTIGVRVIVSSSTPSIRGQGELKIKNSNLVP